MSQQIRQKIDAYDGENFNRLIVELADIALGNGLDAGALTTLDQLVQCEYLNQILLFTTLMSPELKSFAEAQIATLQEKKLIRNDWKAASSEKNENESRRKIAARFLETFKSELDQEKEAPGVLSNEQSEMSQWIDRANDRHVGLLYRIDDKWLVDTSSKIDDGQELYCILPGANGSAKIQSVGAYNSDSLDSNSFFQAGRLIYINSSEK